MSAGGGYLGRGVSCMGCLPGVCLPRGCTAGGGVLGRGCHVWGNVSPGGEELPRGYLPQGGVHLPCEQNEQTGVQTLPIRNFVCGR